MASIVVAALVVTGAPSPTRHAGRLGLTVVAPNDLAGPDAGELGDATHVLIVGEQRQEVVVRRHAAALADRGLAVAWRTLPHGPAAILLLATQAASIRRAPGETVAFLDELAALTWSGAWTPSVANLAEPAPSLGEHVRSWTPGGRGFVVTLSGPAPAVRPVRASAEPDEPVQARGTLFSFAPERIPAAARSHLLTASGCSSLVPLPSLAVDSSGRLGSSKAIEAVALPEGAALTMPRARAACPTCGVIVYSEFCPFCHVRRASSAELRGATA